MDYMTRYQRWCDKVTDEKLAQALKAMTPEEIRESFTMDLEFGTGGLRGVLGPGTARMNLYTVRKATQGLAADTAAHGGKAVAISYDSRHMSQEFAREAACVIAANGLIAWLYPRLMPTPALSFAVRELKCDAGIMITASHNPAIYNGYKAYGPDGCQMASETADRVQAAILATDEFAVKTMPEEEAREKGLIRTIGQDVYEAFIAAVMKQSVSGAQDLKVVYSPLNGTGNVPVRDVLGRIGAQVTVVPSQEMPDGDFPTCSFPNPEERAAMSEGLKLAQELHPDLLLATDPDCDRVGIGVPDGKGGYQLMTGNEVGVLVMDYVLGQRKAAGKLPADPVVVKTIVSTTLAYPIAAKYGAEVRDVLTGFKYIGEQIALLEGEGHPERFQFGFEESYGYLSGTHARDKDAVVASMLICECAAYHKSHGHTLLQAMENIYQTYGYRLNSLLSVTCQGLDGMARISRIMDAMRGVSGSFAGLAIVSVADYDKGTVTDCASGGVKPTGLPRSNVITLKLQEDCQVIARPSGTEPKIKFYFTASGDTRESANAGIDALRAATQAFVDTVK
ncbi:MAG: phospho-sugar mutase [Eubacteriales bacterium]|nr:phospho-sugar mutase [Eubacteriales bacterium]